MGRHDELRDDRTLLHGRSADRLIGTEANREGAPLDPPARLPSEAYRRTIPADYETSWSALIDYAWSTFFWIENFEKDSGLLIASFGASNIARYVDCGTWPRHLHDPRESGGIDLEGPHAVWAERENNGRLHAKTNIRVRAVGAHHTEVVVNARCVLTNATGDRWVLSRGEADRLALTPRNLTAGSPPTRTCQSTQRAERSILDAVDRIASRPQAATPCAECSPGGPQIPRKDLTRSAA